MFRRMPALSASTSRRTAAARWPTGAPLPIPSTRLPYADGPTRCEGRDWLDPYTKTREAGDAQKNDQAGRQRDRCREKEPVLPAHPHPPTVASLREGAESPGVHGQSDSTCLAYSAGKQRNGVALHPAEHGELAFALLHSSHPMGGADRLVLALEKREHSIAHHRAVRQPIVQPQLVDKAENEIGRVGRPHEGDAECRKGQHAKAQRGGRRQSRTRHLERPKVEEGIGRCVQTVKEDVSQEDPGDGGDEGKKRTQG